VKKLDLKLSSHQEKISLSRQITGAKSWFYRGAIEILEKNRSFPKVGETTKLTKVFYVSWKQFKYLFES